MQLAGLGRAPWRLSGAGAILLVHAYSMYVYFYLFVRAALARFDGSLLEAAASLGAGPLRRFLRVTLPALRPALGGAAVLTFLTALGSFSAPYIFGGSYRVMPTQILASKQNGDTDLAEVETVVLTLVAIVGVPDRAPARRARRRRLAGSAARLPLAALRARARCASAWPPPAGASPSCCCAPHLTLALLSLVPRAHLDDRGVAAGSLARQLPSGPVRGRQRCGRSPTRSGWPARRPPRRSCSASPAPAPRVAAAASGAPPSCAPGPALGGSGHGLRRRPGDDDQRRPAVAAAGSCWSGPWPSCRSPTWHAACR